MNQNQNEDDKVAKIVVNVDPEVKQRLQVWAIHYRTTVTNIMHECIEKWLDSQPSKWPKIAKGGRK